MDTNNCKTQHILGVFPPPKKKRKEKRRRRKANKHTKQKSGAGYPAFGAPESPQKKHPSRWADVVVGDILIIEGEGEFPADLVVLASSSEARDGVRARARNRTAPFFFLWFLCCCFFLGGPSFLVFFFVLKLFSLFLCVWGGVSSFLMFL